MEYLRAQVKRLEGEYNELRKAYDECVEKAYAQKQFYEKKITDLQADCQKYRKELDARNTAEVLYLKKQAEKETAREIVKIFEYMLKNEGSTMCAGHGEAANYIYGGTLKNKIEFVKELFSLGEGESRSG